MSKLARTVPTSRIPATRAELRGMLPEQLVALGIQPERVEMSTTLSPVVEAHLDQLVQMAVAQLQRWGFSCRQTADLPIPFLPV